MCPTGEKEGSCDGGGGENVRIDAGDIVDALHPVTESCVCLLERAWQ